MNNMAENRINNIEETLAYQDQKITDLSDMVASQWDEIESLKNYIKRLSDKVDVLESSSDSQKDESLSVSELAEREKPPHY
jgi:uncharacterized coiled-coil protein SlyX